MGSGSRDDRIPRLYAAASLKPVGADGVGLGDRRIPRLYAAASLKLLADPLPDAPDGVDVFRGSMPRPH